MGKFWNASPRRRPSPSCAAKWELPSAAIRPTCPGARACSFGRGPLRRWGGRGQSPRRKARRRSRPGTRS
eukprot:10270694-Alexandrium_andersonii.AAC.1